MWKKEGHIYTVEGEFKWNKSHAQVPVVDVLMDRLRIYYATRNIEGMSNISYIEVSKKNPKDILFISSKPIFSFGKLGAFDDCGMMPTSIINVGEKKYLYYIGWTTRNTVPYQNAIGLAVSEDEGRTFHRFSEGPIISVNHMEPYFSGTAWVMFDNKIFRMWYLSCIGWEIIDGIPEPKYNIKYAESMDGINWKQSGRVAIPLLNDEGGLVSASVLKNGSVYKMWYGKRMKKGYRDILKNTYRIGYAESDDGISWKRMDSCAGIDVSKAGWDSEMISYPYVFRCNGELFLIYNGNGFGKSGFGYAIWHSD